MKRIPYAYKLLAGLLLLAVTFFASMAVGAADATMREVWLAMTADATDDTANMLREIRLPREVAAMFVGAALGVAGAIMQGLTRNPLADPGLLGLTAGAGAALALTVALLPSAHDFAIMIACFVGAAAGAALVIGIGALKQGGFSPLRLVLAGAAVSALLNAVAEAVSLYFKVSKDVSMWTAGGFIGTTWAQLQTIVPVIVAGILAALALSRQLTVLSLNEELAAGLGQKTARVKHALMVVTILLAGASVALVGNLAFIGLMIPHMVRPFVGSDYRFVLPLTAVFGATFMLVADSLARTVNAPFETPLVAIVAMVGLPFFLFVVKKGGHATA